MTEKRNDSAGTRSNPGGRRHSWKAAPVFCLLLLFGAIGAAFPESGSPAPTDHSGGTDQGGIQSLSRAIDSFEACEINGNDHPWMLMHRLLVADGNRDIPTLPGSSRRMKVLDVLLRSRTDSGEPVLACREGKLVLAKAPHDNDFEDHKDQLAYALTQAGFDAKQVILETPDASFTIRDLVELCKQHARADEELAWTIPAIASQGIGASWVNEAGESIDIGSLIDAMLRGDIGESPCGGTHVLYALAYVYRLNEKEKKLPVSLENRVKAFLDGFVTLAKQNQNDDGSFCSEWMFFRKQASSDGERLHACGHMLEWIALYCEESTLREEWVARLAGCAANAVTNETEAKSGAGTIVGMRRIGTRSYTRCCHAVHGMQLYLSRISRSTSQTE